MKCRERVGRAVALGLRARLERVLRLRLFVRIVTDSAIAFVRIGREVEREESLGHRMTRLAVHGLGIELLLRLGNGDAQRDSALEVVADRTVTEALVRHR